MNMQQLREAFAAWPAKYPVDEAAEILSLLTDHAPITEAGLRELGVMDELQKKSNVPLPKHVIGELGIMGIKTLGQLRLLLLSVGES